MNPTQIYRRHAARSQKLRGAISSPRDFLLKYQKDWVEDAAKFKIGVQSRQTGKSFCTACEAVSDSPEGSRARNGSASRAGERQALEWLEKCKEWAQAYKLVVASTSEERPGTLGARPFSGRRKSVSRTAPASSPSRPIPPPPAATRPMSSSTNSPITKTRTKSGRRCFPRSRIRSPGLSSRGCGRCAQAGTPRERGSPAQPENPHRLDLQRAGEQVLPALAKADRERLLRASRDDPRRDEDGLAGESRGIARAGWTTPKPGPRNSSASLPIQVTSCFLTT